MTTPLDNAGMSIRKLGSNSMCCLKCLAKPLSKLAVWKWSFLRWPEFEALARCAQMQGKPPEYMQGHIQAFHELDKAGGPIAVRGAILDLHRRLHEAEWDGA
jgi:hypothetical protein